MVRGWSCWLRTRRCLVAFVLEEVCPAGRVAAHRLLVIAVAGAGQALGQRRPSDGGGWGRRRSGRGGGRGSGWGRAWGELGLNVRHESLQSRDESGSGG